MKVKSKDSRIAKVFNTIISGIINRFSGILIQIVTIPLAINYLGKSQYGLWVTITSLIGLLSFVDGGIGNAVVNMVAHLNGVGKDIVKVVSTAYISILIITIISIILLYLLTILIPWKIFFEYPKNISEDVVINVILVSGAFYFTSTFLSLVGKIQRGFQEGNLENNWNTFGSFISLILICIVIFNDLGFILFIIASLLGMIFSGIFNNIYYFYFIKKEIFPRLSSFDSTLLGKFWKVGGMFFILQVVASIQVQSDNLIIGSLIGVSAVADYSVCMKLFMAFASISTIFLSPLWPAYREALSSGDSSWVSFYFYKSIKFSLAISIPSALILIVFGRGIISMWVPASNPPSYVLLIGCGIWMIFNCIGNALSVYFNAMEYIKFQCIAALLSGFLNILISSILVNFLGADLAVYGSIFSYLLCVLLPSFWIVKKANINFKRSF